MTNYELLNDKGFKYLNYMVETTKELENKIKSYFTHNRDIKLQLILGDELPRIKEEIDKHLDDIISSINELDLNSIDIEKVEKDADELSKLIQYFEYVISRMDETDIEKTCGTKIIQ
jgi:hypothetical protein